MFGNHTLTDITARRDEMVAAGMQGHRDFRVIDSAASGHKIGGGWMGWLVEAMDRPSPVALGNQAAELEALAANPFANSDGDTLKDLARRLRSGYPLSDRQGQLADGIKERILAREAANEPQYQMTEDDHTLVNGLYYRKMYMSSYYWSNRPGASNRLDRLFQAYGRSKNLMREDLEYIKGQFKSVTAVWEEKKFSNGCLVKFFDGRGSNAHVVCMTASDYKFSQQGDIVVDVLVNGSIQTYSVSALSPAVRTRKSKKAEVSSDPA